MTATPDGRTLALGAAWIGVFRWTAQVVSWSAMLVVLRLLTPEDYGIASLALAIIAIAGVLSEFGLGTAVVALPELPDQVARQLHGAACLLGLVVAATAAAVAPMVAGFYREPLLGPVIQVLSLVFLAEGVRLVPQAMLSRRLAYRAIGALDFLRAIATSLAVLLLAWMGKGYWALVLGNLLGAVMISLAVTVQFGLMPRWPRLAELRTPFTYAWHIFAGRGAWMLYRNSDTLIAGRILGSTILGYYTMAGSVASLPGEKLGNVLTAATAPFFAAIQSDRSALRHYFLRVTEVLTLVLYPVLFGFMLVADLAVPLVLGEKWLPAVPVLRLLILFAAIQAVTTPVSQVLNVTGNTRVGMQTGLLALVILPPAFVAGGVLWGMLGIAGAWVLGYPLVLRLPLRVALQALDIPLMEYLRSGHRAAAAVLVMASAVGLVRVVAVGLEAPSWLQLALAIAAGAIGYAGYLWWRHPSLVRAIPTLLRKGTQPGPVGAAAG